MDSRIFKTQFQGSKPILLEIFLYYQKVIKTQMSKMGSQQPIWTSETQAMTKRKVKNQIGNLILDHQKSGIDLTALHLGNVRHTVGKLLTRAITLLQTSLQSEVCIRSYAPSKSRESQLWKFWDSHLGVPGQKNHLDVAPMERCKVYYKGEGVGFPQVRAVVSLMCPSCPWLVLAPKVLQLCTNHFRSV